MSNDLKWESPPSRFRNGRSVVKWSDVAASLISRPGEWAVIAEAATQNKVSACANNAKKGIYAGFTKGDFEAMSRKRGEGDYVAYARYIGPKP